MQPHRSNGSIQRWKAGIPCCQTASVNHQLEIHSLEITSERPDKIATSVQAAWFTALLTTGFAIRGGLVAVSGAGISDVFVIIGGLVAGIAVGVGVGKQTNLCERGKPV